MNSRREREAEKYRVRDIRKAEEQLKANLRKKGKGEGGAVKGKEKRRKEEEAEVRGGAH